MSGVSGNTFRGLVRNVVYLTATGIASVVIVKSIVRMRRDEQFRPGAASALPEGGSSADHYYSNLASVKPGFPLPRDEQDDDSFKRKSKYEGNGMSAATRRAGDKLGFLDRRRD